MLPSGVLPEYLLLFFLFIPGFMYDASDVLFQQSHMVQCCWVLLIAIRGLSASLWPNLSGIMKGSPPWAPLDSTSPFSDPKWRELFVGGLLDRSGRVNTYSSDVPRSHAVKTV